MVLQLLLAMSLTLLSAGQPAATSTKRDVAADDAALAAYLPADIPAAGISRLEGPTFYNPDNLYEYIDGAAEGFLAYDFQRLATATYRYGDRPEQRVVVDLYQVPTGVEGFGIYSSERSPDLKVMRLGAEGYLAGNLCIFWKDRHYVKLAARTGTPEAQQVLLRLARGLAKRLPGPATAPKLLKVFPPTGLVQRSEKYLAHNMLGHAFMPSGFTADYRFGEKDVRVFVAVAKDAEAARDAHRRLRGFFGEFGQVFNEVPGVGDSAFVGKEPFYGRSIVTQQNRIIAGVLGAPEDETAQQLARDLLANTARRLKPGA